jgi:superfamily II DNA or RNA helicase
MDAFRPDYPHFDAYEADVLQEKSTLEQLLTMDGELANYIHLSKYIGPLHPADLPILRREYSARFEQFLHDRLDGVVADPAERTAPYTEQFGDFRKAIAELNQNLPGAAESPVTTLPRPAERLLTKSLRRQGFDPSQMELDHMQRDGTLYLLELFATAAQQEAADGDSLLSELITILDEYREADPDTLVESLQFPVLMVSLWKNQLAGLEAWLDEGRAGILEMATATGKTVAGIGAIAHLCGVLPNHDFDVWAHTARTDGASIIVVAHSNAILSQWEREIRDLLGLNVAGADRSGQPDPLSFATGRIEFHTIHSMLAHNGGPPDKTFDLAIVDEAHHYANTGDGGYGDALQSLQAEAVLGLSATLGREGTAKRQTLEALLGEVVYTYDIEDAQADGIIPEFEWTVHPTALDPDEADEWEQKTTRISNQFSRVQNSSETRRILKSLDVPFNRMEDLGDFIRAHKEASVERDDVPDSWQNLHVAIQDRNLIRHRSKPKLDGAIELARDYLTAEGDGIKMVMFAMNIDVADRIGKALEAVTDNVFVVHSKVASSNAKKDRIVRSRIDEFETVDNGVLIAPQLLDEGVDVPDAEVGINVAGTKTELQLIQRMGRILRKHGDQRPHFHHYVAVPDEQHLDGVDGKALAQELYWVRELGERIGRQPDIEPAAVDPDVVARARQRGNELWAEELIAEEDVESVDGPIDLEEILASLTPTAAEILLEEVTFRDGSVPEADWEYGMTAVRERSHMPPNQLQQIWWLYPIYQDHSTKLKTLLEAAQDRDAPTGVPTGEGGSTSGSFSGGGTNSGSTAGGSTSPQGGGESASPIPLESRELDRLQDIVALAPTSNGELADEWDYESGSAVYQYLSSELDAYYTRGGENYKIVLSESGQELIERV